MEIILLRNRPPWIASFYPTCYRWADWVQLGSDLWLRFRRWAPGLLRSGPPWGWWSACPERHSPSPQGWCLHVVRGAPPVHKTLRRWMRSKDFASATQTSFQESRRCIYVTISDSQSPNIIFCMKGLPDVSSVYSLSHLSKCYCRCGHIQNEAVSVLSRSRHADGVGAQSALQRAESEAERLFVQWGTVYSVQQIIFSPLCRVWEPPAGTCWWTTCPVKDTLLDTAIKTIWGKKDSTLTLIT